MESGLLHQRLGDSIGQVRRDALSERRARRIVRLHAHRVDHRVQTTIVKSARVPPQEDHLRAPGGDHLDAVGKRSLQPLVHQSTATILSIHFCWAIRQAMTPIGPRLRTGSEPQRRRLGRSARTCGDSAKAFTSAQGRLTNGPEPAPKSNSVQALASASEAQRFKIH